VCPDVTFQTEKYSASLKGAIKNIGIAGVICGAIYALIAILCPEVIKPGYVNYGISMRLLVAVLYLVLSPILITLSLLIESGILYIFARVLDGRGTYTVQTYLMSLFMPPLIIINVILNISQVGYLSVVVGIFMVYVLTIALMKTHGYDLWKAIVTWLMPLIITTVLAIALITNLKA